FGVNKYPNKYRVANIFTCFFRGFIRLIGVYNVVITFLPKGRININSAASVIGDMARNFPNLRFVIIIKISCKIPTVYNNIRFGDVIVNISGNKQGGIRHYDFGVFKQNAGFKKYGHLNGPQIKILNIIPCFQTKYTKRGYNFEKRITANLNQNFRIKKQIFPPEGRYFIQTGLRISDKQKR
ncbi:uncharacterized protein PgNI_11987, partial [Pyricularia grisea]|uniref:Uncharacterized protein n=1 Tax=Pyricularia grisea TaxID=148305 RepID=A0A6P8AQU4_PYRGI